MTVLADTSIWIEYLRRGPRGMAHNMADLLELGEIVLCGPVLAEVLAGTRRDERATIASLLVPQPWIPLGQKEWLRVGLAASQLRDRGLTVALSDIEIAVAAEVVTASIWTIDTAFERIATIMDLRFYRPD